MKKQLLNAFYLLFLFIITAAPRGVFAQVANDFRSVGGGGDWTVPASWERFDGSAWVATSSTPGSSTPTITIKSGSTITINGGTRSCRNLIIEAGATLKSDQDATAASGGREFIVYGSEIQNNGTFGVAGGNGIVISLAAASGDFNINGTGTAKLSRFRPYSGGGTKTITFNQNITFDYALGDYAITALYSPVANDNYTLTIKAGKTITVSHTGGRLHTNSSVNNSTYTYNIEGILDLSATTSSSSINITPVGGAIINLNVSGKLITGTGGIRSLPASSETAKLAILNGGEIDARIATVMDFNNNSYFTTTGTGRFRRNVLATSVETLFPLGVTGEGANYVSLKNSGTANEFSISLKNTFDNSSALADATKTVKKQWTITPGGVGSNVDISLNWSTSDQAANFSPTNPLISMIRYNGTIWQENAVSLSGSGAVSSPYSAVASGLTQFGDFGISNGTIAVLPLNILSFQALLSNGLKKEVNLLWKTTNEINTQTFSVEKSLDGKTFNSIGKVKAKNIEGNHQYSFLDVNPNDGINYYQLKQTDLDGSIQLSDIVAVNNKSKISLSVYPNPVKQTITINHPKAGVESVLSISGLEGKILLIDNISQGLMNSSYDISKLPAGLYFLTYRNGSEISSLKFIKD